MATKRAAVVVGVNTTGELGTTVFDLAEYSHPPGRCPAVGGTPPMATPLPMRFPKDDEGGCMFI
jgi:hypothetical protein